jgi:hypothetical protein
MIRNKVRVKIFVSIETCDTEARYMENIAIETLETGGHGEVFLLTNES